MWWKYRSVKGGKLPKLILGNSIVVHPQLIHNGFPSDGELVTRAGWHKSSKLQLWELESVETPLYLFFFFSFIKLHNNRRSLLILLHQKTLFILHQLNNKTRYTLCKGLGTRNRGQWVCLSCCPNFKFQNGSKTSTIWSSGAPREAKLYEHTPFIYNGHKMVV